MQSVVGNSSKVLVDQKSGGNSLLYLPLDRLIQQSGPAAGAASADAQAARPAVPPADAAPALEPSRSREALRSRERNPDTR
jgi:modulator of FtsH protease HflK